MAIKSLFNGAKFVGQAEGDRQSYYVFETSTAYLVAAPRDPNNYSVTVVRHEAPDVIGRKFKGDQVTVKDLKSLTRHSNLFRGYFDRLNALYVMVALGRATKLKKRMGRAMLFKIR
jgi:hypothetical protein